MIYPNEQQLREEIVQVGRLMYEKGLIVASDGNVSARIGRDRLLITPSGLSKGMLQPGHLLIVNMDGQVVGPRTAVNRTLKPTSELPMHLEAYRQRPDVQAVVHAHPPITVALSIAGVSLADCLLPEVIVFLGIIPTTEYAMPSSPENARAIRQLIRHHDGIVLQRHGSLTVGDTPMQAYMRLETMEQQARIRFMLAQLGAHNPLPPHEVNKLLQLRQQMGLGHAAERVEFCEVCGVCHEKDEHLPPRSAGLSGQTAVSPDLDALKEMVSQVVHKTLGNQAKDY